MDLKETEALSALCAALLRYLSERFWVRGAGSTPPINIAPVRFTLILLIVLCAYMSP